MCHAEYRTVLVACTGPASCVACNPFYVHLLPPQPLLSVPSYRQQYSVFVRTHLVSPMTLYQRLSRSSSAGDEDEASSDIPVIKTSPKKYQLLLASEVPKWYAHNSHLRTGYRPVNESVEICVDSWRFLHNETVNIYSHMIPAAIAIIFNCCLHIYFRELYPNAALQDRLAIHVYLTSSVLCFSISSVYHTLNCHSEAYSDLWARWDYAAIIFQTIGSFVSGVYVTFYCNPWAQLLHWAIVSDLPSSFPYNLRIYLDYLTIPLHLDRNARNAMHTYPCRSSISE